VTFWVHSLADFLTVGVFMFYMCKTRYMQDFDHQRRLYSSTVVTDLLLVSVVKNNCDYDVLSIPR